MTTRQPIIAVVGHIDHGKTTLLDKIRGSAIAQYEKGGISQHIGATEIPMDAIKKASCGLIDKLKMNLTIPGILMIDTPGHEAFTNLRKRGGSISDIAILVVDIREGFKAQTREALEMLKQFKVPFIVVANKIDLLSGWNANPNSTFMQSLKKQSSVLKEILDNSIYKQVIALSDYGINAERFDRVEDYTKQVAIVPVSAVTGEGIPELLMVLTGLAQKYLEQKLKLNTEGPGKGSIIEMKEERGLGNTIDVVLYDGTIKVGDTIVMPGITEPIVTKVRALMKPSPLKELREKGKFQTVKSVTAAAGIKLSAPEIENAVAGMPVVVANTKEEQEKAKEELQKEIKSILKTSDEEGVIIRADTIGALEALEGLFKKIDLNIRRASVGDVTKTDILEAKRMKEKNELIGAIFAFNVKMPKDVEELAKKEEVKLFEGEIVYSLYEEYQKWKYELESEKRKQALAKLVWPGKVKVLKDFVFRQSNPAVVGVEILGGGIKTKARLINESGKEIGEISQIQSEGKTMKEAKGSQRVAISIPGATVGKTIKEGDVLYAFIPRSNLEIIKSEFITELSKEEIQILKETEALT